MSTLIKRNKNFIIPERKSILPEIYENKGISRTKNDNNLNNLNNKSININKNLKKAKSKIYQIRNSKSIFNLNQSLTDLKNRKSFKQKTFILKPNNKNENNLNLRKESDCPHNIRISNLLDNAKNFFNNLENILEVNKPEEIPYLNPSKIYKKLSTVRKKDILFPKAITKKENDISKLYGRMYNIKILNDDEKNSKINNNYSILINKSIAQNENDEINNNNNMNQDDETKKKKLYNDQIVQTYNISKYKSIDIEENNKNNVLPILNSNKYNNDNEYDQKHDKNDIKIAEIREVYPCYPYNRLMKYLNSTRTNNKNNKFKNFGFDIKYTQVSNSRYYYEKFLRDIKFGNNDVNKKYMNYNRIRKSSSTNDVNKINNIYI